MGNLEIRSYQSTDKERVVEIFRTNCPKYFDPNDEGELVDFLENYTDENFLVALSDGVIIGCCGHYTKAQQHGIAWTFFESNSIGYKEFFRVVDSFYSEIENRIKAENTGFTIYINTTQLMERLFNKYGFNTYAVIPDGFGEGLDEYKMKK
ncbi:N-acetyltransferase [Sediminitomix flava]|uniref:N-acetyltransferase domain-containing protein n=1 Tax=Sediminitomix flava TaxID=379075 RepID=A0A315ZEQ6_SEDFL|nr:N-acetyltransferase [Sediminitomix flava]PWJ44045.1 hypothetical protein BC781_101395 [Sediminitomix flava]